MVDLSSVRPPHNVALATFAFARDHQKMPDRPSDAATTQARPPKRPPQQERGQRRVDDILDAAAALVAEGGSAAATVQAIGQRAGASKGSMYHFFRDGESVLLALVDRHVERLRHVLALARGAAAPSPAGPDDAADRFLDPLNGYVLDHPDLSRLMTEPTVATQLGRQREALIGLVEEHAAWVVRLVAPGLDARSVGRVAATLGVLASVLRNPRVVAAAGSAEAGRAEGRRAVVEYLRSYAEPDPARGT
jgi:AcrR family transcriptional regulator